ncbi:MAG TPA: hypothetical protein VE956_02095 [Nodularia sp. (in: cyanobacteria)]|nr:hypothetical protein [Nodularia sp. (in: cyanobacteria)]
MSNKYKGKRVAVTLPLATYELVVKVAEAETRTVASAALVLIEQALRDRGMKD